MALLLLLPILRKILLHSCLNQLLLLVLGQPHILEALLQLQVRNAVSHTGLVLILRKILLRSYLNQPLLLVLSQPHILEALLDIKAKVAVLIKVMSIAGHKSICCLFCLNYKVHQHLKKELNHLILNRLFFKIPYFNKNKTFNLIL